MRTDAWDHDLDELDWDRLVGWFAELCRRERAADCLPAALWLVCSCPPTGGGSGASESEVDALGELSTALRDGVQRLVEGRLLPRPIERRSPLTWKILAENLRGVRRAEPDRLRPYLWFTVQFFGRLGTDLKLDDPAEDEIRALLNDVDLYHPDLLPAVRRMMSTIPAASVVLDRWQPPDLSPEQKIVRKMGHFLLDALREMKPPPESLAGLDEEVSRWARQLLLAADEIPKDQLLIDLPTAALHRVDQIIDDPTLSFVGKSAAILEVLTLGAKGKVVCH